MTRHMPLQVSLYGGAVFTNGTKMRLFFFGHFGMFPRVRNQIILFCGAVFAEGTKMHLFFFGHIGMFPHVRSQSVLIEGGKVT